MQAPSKKIIILFISCCVALALIFIAQKLGVKAQPTLTTTSESQTEEKDTDNDGLKDWEEALRGTKITEKDTDNDGTTDGDEVSQNRDPLKSGPNDSLVVEKKASTTTYFKQNTLTEQFAQDFFSRYSALKADGSVSQQSKDALIESMIRSYEGSQALTPHFSGKELQAFDATDIEKTRLFANNFALIENKSVTTIQAAIRNQEFGLAAEESKRLAQTLVSLPVPNTIANNLLSIANGYYATGEILTSITTSQSDIVKTLYLVEQVRTLQLSITSSYYPIASFIKNSGIIFNADEPGRYWLELVQ